MIIFLLFVLVLLVGCAQPSEDLAKADIVESTANAGEVMSDGSKIIDTTLSTFEFEGYAVGKSHAGTFDVYSGSLSYDGETLVAANGVIDATTVNTGIKGLDTHLKADDFFNVAVNPTIEFTSSAISYDAQTGNGTATGSLLFNGVTNDVTFPVMVTSEGMSTEFLLDTTPFNMKNAGVNKEVRIAFTFVAE